MREDNDVKLIRRFLIKIDAQLDVYSQEIERLENKKQKLHRKQNGLLKELNEKTGGKIND